MRVELLHLLCLQVLPLDAVTAPRAKRVVQLVVVVLAVGVVLVDVEVSRREWRFARLTPEALLVVAARQPAVSCLAGQ